MTSTADQPNHSGFCSGWGKPGSEVLLALERCADDHLVSMIQNSSRMESSIVLRSDREGDTQQVEFE